MIYLDNSATTFPKPVSVYNAVNQAMRNFGANPGRSGHSMSIRAAEQVYKCREAVARFYNIKEIENIIFTQNCTYATNTIIKGFLKKGDHVVISDLEHNSVLRPINQLSENGITFTTASVEYGDFEKTVDNFRKSINEKTSLMIITHASNVTGTILPIGRITALAHQYNIKVLIDAAQTSGVIPIDVDEINMDFLATAGHKGLMGPMGTGIMYVKEPDLIFPLVCGGTGSSSLDIFQPRVTPDKFESGTCNLPGICGLLKGIEFIERTGIKKIHNYEFALLELLYSKLERIKNVKLYTPKPQINYNAPLLSFNIGNIPSEQVAETLDKKYNIAVRAGLHCAPTAHKKLQTENQGTVRISLSYFNTINHINSVSNAVKNISDFYSKKINIK
ncbi:MAG: aminotransferase class V-fold PLP-dependent enzyme [Acutalibacteraceae bacterium]|nr:aminotransferase class V-fold PLP-dependent enzyme [Acutalibacteraceae bacterium]